MSYFDNNEMTELAANEFARCAEDDDVLACRAPALECWQHAVANSFYLGGLAQWEALPLATRLNILKYGSLL